MGVIDPLRVHTSKMTDVTISCIQVIKWTVLTWICTFETGSFIVFIFVISKPHNWPARDPASKKVVYIKEIQQ